MRKPKHFYVYIMASNSRHHVLYTGITGNLPRRVIQHKHKLIPGFTSRYNVTRLVYHEMFCYPDMAIAREKEIKRLASQQEDRADRRHESALARPGSGMGRRVQALWALRARSFAARRSG
jgi:putative endonuclease